MVIWEGNNIKILQVNDEKYRVYGDGLKIRDKLDPGVYTIDCSQFEGFFLMKHAPLTVKEKLYGPHQKKVEKIIRSFDVFKRSMGVIFSGEKGIGKSIASRLLSEKMVAKGYPVILVQEDIDGIADFIDSIQQECMVLFDEFEKTFPDGYEDGGDEKSNAQDKLLSLFDGTSSDTKRLYVITCNNVYKLSDFLVNRPGLFHYHIRWDYPKPEEIEEYLRDNLQKKYYGEIEKVIRFRYRTHLNFDCLRAIVFELNLGTSFEEAIGDINIINTEDPEVVFRVVLKDGSIYFDNDAYSYDFCKRHLATWAINKESGPNELRNVRLSFVPATAIYSTPQGFKFKPGHYKVSGAEGENITDQVKYVEIEPLKDDSFKFENILL